MFETVFALFPIFGFLCPLCRCRCFALRTKTQWCSPSAPFALSPNQNHKWITPVAKWAAFCYTYACERTKAIARFIAERCRLLLHLFLVRLLPSLLAFRSFIFLSFSRTFSLLNSYLVCMHVPVRTEDGYIKTDGVNVLVQPTVKPKRNENANQCVRIHFALVIFFSPVQSLPLLTIGANGIAHCRSFFVGCLHSLFCIQRRQRTKRNKEKRTKEEDDFRRSSGFYSIHDGKRGNMHGN